MLSSTEEEEHDSPDTSPVEVSQDTLAVNDPTDTLDKQDDTTQGNIDIEKDSVKSPSSKGQSYLNTELIKIIAPGMQDAVWVHGVVAGVKSQSL